MKRSKFKVKQKPGPAGSKDHSSKHSLNYVVIIVACVAGICISYLATDHGDANLGTTLIERAHFNTTCSDDYKTRPMFKYCTPTKTCGRVIRDNIVSTEEANRLLDIAKRGFAHGGSSGGASILDLHSGALSLEDKFVNIFKYLEGDALRQTFSDEDFKFYAVVKNRVHETIANEFGIDSSRLHLTHPTFFSRITNATAKTQHDEYWHKHIDKIQYGSFDYTSLLYLAEYNKDFTGGRFIFDGKERLIVEPRKGRLSFFTSGSENPHHVEKVESGVRYAITISFTCDPKKSIRDPKLKK